jgi:hypothetical protein
VSQFRIRSPFKAWRPEWRPTIFDGMRAERAALAIVIGVSILAFAGGVALRVYRLPEFLIGFVGAVAAGAYLGWSYWRRNDKGS